MMRMNKTDTASGICADIKTVCKKFGNRNAGSEGERQAAEYFAAELASCADEVKIEEFKVNPAAYVGWIPVSVTAVMLGYVAYFFSSMVALLLFIAATLPFIFEYLLGRRALDALYKEKSSQNVTAVKRCAGEARSRLYFVANIDAPFENSLKYRLGGVAFICVLVLDIVAIMYFAAISVARWVFVGGIGAAIATGPMLYAGIAGCAFLIPLFMSYFFTNRKVVIDGANSSLTGCFVALNALCAIEHVTFENTEVGVLITGSGAVGLRGAKAWCEAHADDVDKQNTVFICLNTLRELGSLNVNSSEAGFTVKNDKDAMKLALDAAAKLGLKCSNRAIPFEATDSAALSENGFKSASIIAVNRHLPDYCNTRYDSYDNLSAECIGECFELALEIIRAFADGDGAIEAEKPEEEEPIQETEQE